MIGNHGRETMSGTANINPETGIAYGYISAGALDSDLVDTLTGNGTDLFAKEALAEWHSEKAIALFNAGGYDDIHDADEDVDDSEFWDCYEAYEPVVEGQYDDVVYSSSWLGGALHFFIYQSPVTTDHARLASPCVPNAGILDTLDGDVTSYNVPDDWRRCNED